MIPPPLLGDAGRSPPPLANPGWRLSARLHLLERASPFNLFISNVPGPRVPVYYAGALLLAYCPVSAIAHGQGLNITVMSYRDRLCFGLLGCRPLVPDIERLAGWLGTSSSCCWPRPMWRTAGTRPEGPGREGGQAADPAIDQPRGPVHRASVTARCRSAAAAFSARCRCSAWNWTTHRPSSAAAIAGSGSSALSPARRASTSAAAATEGPGRAGRAVWTGSDLGMIV
jgi:hypothetical protein